MAYTLKNSATRLNKIAVIISQVIHLDVEIADNHLFRIVGTGKLKNKSNQSMANEGHAYSIALKTGQPQIISDPGSDSICQNCSQRNNCKETFEISYPIRIGTEVIGVIGLIAYTKQQQQRLKKDLASYSAFLEKMSEFIAFDITDLNKRQSQDLSVSILETVLNEVNLGILTINADNQVELVNRKAQALLKIPISTDSQSSVEKLPQSSKGANEFLLHIDGRHYQVLGKLYHTDLQEHNAILLFSENRMLTPASRKKSAKALPGDAIIGNSPAINKLRRQISQLSYFKVPVMIQAEHGLEVRETAIAIHESSTLSGKRLYELNCAAYSSDILYTLLFSADGILKKAAGHSLFLRNVDHLSIHLQMLLQDTLETGQLPIDGRMQKLNGQIRIISSCERDMEALLHNGGFSQGLYYRLSSDIIRIPPLRERGDDLLVMSKFFLRQQKSLLAASHFQYSKDFSTAVLNYSWPGNIPQLKNVMDQISIRYPNASLLTSDLLPAEIRTSSTYPPASDHADISEEEAAIRLGLKKYGNSVEGKQQLADDLGMGIATLYRKIKKYNLS